MSDFLLPFRLESSSLRGRVIRLDSVLEEILKAHNYPAPVSTLCADMVLLCGLLSSMLKYNGIFTLQAQGDGALKMMVCDMTSEGHLRACASFKEGEIEEDEAPDLSLFGKGYLAFTVDQGAHTERYQGIVDLKGRTLTDSIQHYFSTSEQIRTGIIIAAAPDEAGKWRGQGILLQHMPEEGGKETATNIEEDDWRRAMILMQSCTKEELLDPALSAEDILTRLFHEEGVRVYDRTELKHQCRCSKERLQDLLKTMPKDDIEHMVEDGKISMHCEFCAKDYVFDPKDYL